MKQEKICIKGMHCRSCELLVEDELLKVPGIKKAVVSQSAGTAEIQCDCEIDPKQIEQAVTNAGYSLGVDEKTFISRNPKVWRDLGIALFLALDLYIIANFFGLFHINFVSSNNYNSLPIVLLIGITAGFSTCMALIGGLILGASAKFAQKHPNATVLEKFKPHIFFNAGRIVSYFVFGALIGYLGSFFQLSNTLLGVLIIAVGGVMLLLGFQLLDVFPPLKKISISLPKGVSRFFGIKEQGQKEYSNKNALVLGATTIFLPCAFTQAMILFAMASGSAITGALALGVFAIGTTPGLLAVGGLSSIVKGTGARLFFKTAGIVVIFLALFNIQNGYNLTGLNISPQEVLATIFNPNVASATGGEDPNVTLENGLQVVRMTQSGSGYSPNTFTIKRDIPVRWIINSTDPYTCAASIVSSQLSVRKSLGAGENIIEFTPTEVGTIKFSCSMGMYTGSFNVVDSTGSSTPQTQAELAQNQPAVPAPNTAGSCGSQGGCGCGSGAKKAQIVVPAEPSAAEQIGAPQIIKTSFTLNEDIRPNQFTVKVGQPVRFEVIAKEDGQGCMGSITIPGLTDKVDLLTAGKTAIFEFTSKKTGSFPITCAMGVPRGEIKVI